MWSESSLALIRKLKSEYVVVSAHLDHVGVGEPINGDRIYNGAMDDASGVATILDVAQSLHDSRRATKTLRHVHRCLRRGERSARIPLLCRAPHRAGGLHGGESEYGHVPAHLPAQQHHRLWS